MKTLNLLPVILSFFISVGGVAQTAHSNSADTLTWYTDVTKANEVSKATGKPIFALFTGSDWCIWCHRLHDNVFVKPAFIQWAKKNVVLLELDFPRYKKQDPEIAQQNQGLQQTFQIKGYPTVWMFYLAKGANDKAFTINPLGSCGYPTGMVPGQEAEKFIETANGILATKK